jgi:hypothetical protein
MEKFIEYLNMTDDELTNKAKQRLDSKILSNSNSDSLIIGTLFVHKLRVINFAFISKINDIQEIKNQK